MNNELQEYLTTGMLGAYHPENAILRETEDGHVDTIFRDDKRGFDILPDGTHGTSGFLTEKEMRTFLEMGPLAEVKGMMLGKYKRHSDDPDKYALYIAHAMKAGDNNNLLCIGAPGSRKSRGFIIPFLLGCADRGESVFITGPKSELFEKMSPYFVEKGYYVKAVNLSGCLSCSRISRSTAS